MRRAKTASPSSLMINKQMVERLRLVKENRAVHTKNQELRKQKQQLDEEYGKAKDIQDKIIKIKQPIEDGSKRESNINCARLLNEKLRYTLKFLKDNTDILDSVKLCSSHSETKNENSVKSKIHSLRKSNAILESQIESLKIKKSKMEEFMYSQFDEEERKA